MTLDGQHRYTDREVALVLKRAAELEEARQSDAPSRGLTLQQLHEIARDVGLNPQVVDNAVNELSTRGRLDPKSLLGPSPLHKVVRAVPNSLDHAAMQRLIQIVEDQLSATGTVSEALGSVRWTSTADGRQMSHTVQVAITPSSSETQIQVTERLSPRLRRVLHLLPGAWGTMAAMAVVGSASVPLIPAIGILGGGGLFGVAVGRAIWSVMTRRSKAKVHRIAATLTEEASHLASRES